MGCVTRRVLPAAELPHVCLPLSRHSGHCRSDWFLIQVSLPQGTFFLFLFFSQLVSPLILEEELLNLRPRGALGSYVSGIFITFLGVIGLPRALKLHLKYLITPRNFGGLILQDSIRGFLLQSEYYILGT